ncbi:c11orf73-like protein, putative (macronuclear) [Tetrahymena thermophila SB210]|uniref:C11orf73-like protein, putative n=1 Tax=Tetrahymena thermophila (strain SB210) TaxID=312017 RepID=Q22YS0_TETTS|nr:c11orf73-like protein, putative [Tetrahymena thermophila SB210]EAR90601.1 c11orf73-like protein, putative [Tetrahymena thermophila SB210]|eukprot:XP_001010846.1 c11orf73-like protein, putative [Tetrahymena thermophila SB210]
MDPNQMIQTPGFGIMIPGQIPFMNFEFINGMFCVDLPNPAAVPNLAFFLNVPIQDGFGASLYYSAPPFESIHFIGAIANVRPSDIFRTGFPVKPDVNQCQSIKLVVKMQPLSELQDLVTLSDKIDSQKQYAKLVAQNLYNFMMSYNNDSLVSQIQSNGNYLVIPSNFLEKWYQKFEMKYKMDPNFIYKTEMQ